ncbi:MAG: IclR family transcriptional regulator [Micrococcaceae bacterium]
MPRRREGAVSALGRHLRILDAFEVGTAFLSLSEIAQRAELPVSTVHRLVAELEGEGLLERLPDRSYQLGLRLWELASRTPRALGLREIAAPMMRLVQDQVRQHTQLGVEGGFDVVYLDRLSRHDAVVNATVVGGRISLGASAIGHVLLLNKSTDFLQALVDDGIHRYTELTPRTLAELQRVLEDVRRRGVAIADGFVHPLARGMAAPIFGPDGAVVAGLGVVVPSTEPVQPRDVELLKTAAAAITKQLRRAYVDPGHPHALPGAKFRVLLNSSASSMQYFDEETGAITERDVPRW